jgi:hypothetical protein
LRFRVRFVDCSTESCALIHTFIKLLSDDFSRAMAVLLRSPVAAILILLAMTGCPAAAEPLYEREADGHFIYYPAGENEIAERLAAEVAGMHRFLEKYRLTVKAPVHVILDNKRDTPRPEVNVIPHREIRLPLRAPGVFEDGWLQPDPWRYYLFKGLCLQAIYGMRSGLPGAAARGFGEIVSPNVVLPEWITDGVCHWLYTRFDARSPQDVLNDALFRFTPLPDLDDVSNHPEKWPGHYTYRVFGRRFVAWVAERYGWDGLYGFLHEHGRGILPIEIDLKAERSLGQTWPGLWRLFRQAFPNPGVRDDGIHLIGYWSDPFIFWNRAGVYPGVQKIGHRGRYGFLDADGALWLSQYDEEGASKLVRFAGDQPVWLANKHIWDPGPGGVAVGRDGHRPCLVVFPTDMSGWTLPQRLSNKLRPESIPAPDGVIQLCGPVMDRRGRIAVAGNTKGNWDIWLYDKGWRRLTESLAADIDPWFEAGDILYATSGDGTFRIIDTDGRLRSACDTMAVMPRDGNCLCLSGNGWSLTPILPDRSGSARNRDAKTGETPGVHPGGRSPTDHREDTAQPTLADVGRENPAVERRYHPLRSVLPNYLTPELFIGESDLQLGVSTLGYDVSGDYTVDGGIRYSTDSEYWSLRAGVSAMRVGLRYTRYPFSYGPALSPPVDESRQEVKAYWRPWESEKVELSVNYRIFEDNLADSGNDTDTWGALHLLETHGRHGFWMNMEWFTDDSLSLFGGGKLVFGDSIYTMLHMQAGKTWGSLTPGHNTFRIGGNVVEGYFTQRPSRLFPLRGFESNFLDASQAVTSGLEIFWPLANLQAGYKTLPLFLHRMMLGTFVDTGIAAESFSGKDILVAGGVELVTSLEIAWGNFSSFRIGAAWPLRQPEGLDEKGPVFLIQLGKPL